MFRAADAYTGQQGVSCSIPAISIRRIMGEECSEIRRPPSQPYERELGGAATDALKDLDYLLEVRANGLDVGLTTPSRAQKLISQNNLFECFQHGLFFHLRTVEYP